MIKGGLLLILVICCCVQTHAQLFKLDSVLISRYEGTSALDALLNGDNKGRLPVFTDKTFMKFFKLQDTVLSKIQLNYFLSKDEMIQAYSLKKDDKQITCVRFKILDITESEIRIKVEFGSFKCDKWLLKKKAKLLIVKGGSFEIRYNNPYLSKGRLFLE